MHRETVGVQPHERRRHALGTPDDPREAGEAREEHPAAGEHPVTQRLDERDACERRDEADPTEDLEPAVSRIERIATIPCPQQPTTTSTMPRPHARGDTEGEGLHAHVGAVIGVCLPAR